LRHYQIKRLIDKNSQSQELSLLFPIGVLIIACKKEMMVWYLLPPEDLGENIFDSG